MFESRAYGECKRCPSASFGVCALVTLVSTLSFLSFFQDARDSGGHVPPGTILSRIASNRGELPSVVITTVQFDGLKFSRMSRLNPKYCVTTGTDCTATIEKAKIVQ